MLFEAETIELSAQPGEMVGVEREERLTTPWLLSLKFRHPWLQINLFSGLLAAVVVGYFQETIDRVIALAVFLPVLIGQAANTGVQALAVSLRGMTLGDLTSGRERMLVTKEMLLGAFNGAFTGVTGGIAMFVFATMVKSPVAVMLGVIVFLATTISCLISGVVGAVVPLVLKKWSRSGDGVKHRGDNFHRCRLSGCFPRAGRNPDLKRSTILSAVGNPQCAIF